MVPGAGIEPARSLSSEGFSYQLQLSLLRTGVRICGLDFLFALLLPGNVGGSRQVSTLS